MKSSNAEQKRDLLILPCQGINKYQVKSMKITLKQLLSESMTS